MSDPYYRVTVKLERVTPITDDKGYTRLHSDEVSEVTLTGGMEQNVLNQAYQHVGILVGTYTPVKATKGGFQ